MKLPKVTVKAEYTKFSGGLDQETPALTFPAGAVFASLNYTAGTDGGYRRIDGYERYDGRTKPSEGTYYYLDVVFTDTVSVGDTITGSVSGETGVVVVSGAGFLDISKASGVFQEEAFTVGGVPKGTITNVALNGEDTALTHATAKGATADLYRTDIAKPSGSLAVRGVGMLKGVVYAFVDNPGGTAGLIYKPTTSGWSAITLYHEISFDTGIADVYDGDSVTQLVSGATATVKRVVHESGVWGSTAAGRLILDSIVGTFTNTNDIQVAAATKVTATSLATQITISPGGRYETIEHNFTGSLDTKRMYGADGVNQGFEFDGDIYVPISTGMVTDTPEYVAAYKSQLFFSFKASSQNSGVGTPYKWTAVTGAAEIALGDNITGYVTLSSALGILSRDSSYQLLGNNVDDFVLDPISDEVGCIPRTAQRLGYSYCLDDRGVIRITPTLNYGNFKQTTISRKVQPLIDSIRKVAVASTVYRSLDQYRIYGSDGTGVAMTIHDKGFSFMFFEYPDNVSCAVSGEDSTGKDVVFFGSDDGMVYQADMGSSFDGEDIEGFVMLPFNNSQSPTTLKTYRKGTMEMTCESYSALKFSTEFAYGDPNISSSIVNNIPVSGPGGIWDVSNWDEFFYDTAVVLNPSFRINGTAINLSLTVYAKSAIDDGHKLDGIITHYTPRRIVR